MKMGALLSVMGLLLVVTGCQYWPISEPASVDSTSSPTVVTADATANGPTMDRSGITAPTRCRALSLRVLQERLEAIEGNPTCPSELSHLGGLSKVTACVIDEKNHDVVILGEADSSAPQLHVEDMILALRASWLKYAEIRGSVQYISSPGCSIDPNPRVIATLQDLGRSSSPGSSDWDGFLAAWNRVGVSPQNVRVMGLPFDSHFANIMVLADYLMKRLVDGSETLPGVGLVSLADRALEQAKQDALQEKPLDMSLGMNRFWFCPGRNSYIEDRGIIVIQECPVTLLTEQEHLGNGTLQGEGHVHPLAESFAQDFTACYYRIARAKPIYTELEDLFRFVALAKIMQVKDMPAQAGMDLSYLLDRCSVPVAHVARTLPGRVNVKDFRLRRDGPRGYQTLRVSLPTCGGVSIEIGAQPTDFSSDTTGTLTQWKVKALAARPELSALTWEFESPTAEVKRTSHSRLSFTPSAPRCGWGQL